jgi:hypothetical protein
MASAPQKIRIGRDAASDLVLADKSVSRRHADLFIDESGSMEILDLESSGGTYLIRNGEEDSISRARLKPSDLLRFGEVEMTYKDLLEQVQKLRPKEISVKHAKPPPLPPPVKRATPPPLPKTGAKSGGRMTRCECGTIKPKGSACPSCGP